jgi:pimeloyl-ACP methyl ester carboxylesterase
MRDDGLARHQAPRDRECARGPAEEQTRGRGVPRAEQYRTAAFVHEGHQLVYDTYGEGDCLLVYTHGLLLDAELNRGIAAALAGRGNRVVLLDLLGHGRSDKPTRASAYRIDRYAAQVFGLLDHLRAPEAVLGGLSLGANVSLFAASLQPERARALVLEMPVLEWAVPAAAMTFVPILLAAHYGRPVAGFFADLIRRVPETPFGPLNSLLHAAAYRPEVLAAILHGVLVGPVAPTLEERAAITAPTLILAHSHDLLHPFNDAHNLAHQLPAAALAPSRSPFELRIRPQRLTDRIAAFLRDVWEPAGDAAPGTGTAVLV